MSKKIYFSISLLQCKRCLQIAACYKILAGKCKQKTCTLYIFPTCEENPKDFIQSNRGQLREVGGVYEQPPGHGIFHHIDHLRLLFFII